ncbi:MAG: DM13 domain-containing protein [Chloroflexota bacterium]|nr:DM13 domain-containing protein [Chloroflexota bacterium]
MKRRTLVILATLLALGAAAVPLVAFVIVPQFVRSTLVETPAESGAVTVRSGELVKISIADYGTGTVRIVRTGTTQALRFESVDIAGAPDVYVYLSDKTDGTPGSFIDLGRLKATNGTFSYAIPAGVDPAAIRSVVLWCRQFSVTITYANFR